MRFGFLIKIVLALMVVMIPTAVYSLGESNGIKYQIDNNIVPYAVGFLGVSLIAAHTVSPENYSLTENTISELGSQNYNNAWIINAGFIGAGSLISSAAAWDLFSGRKLWVEAVPLILYGASLTVTGFYSTAPFEGGIPYSAKEENIHSLFANIAGFALTGAMLGAFLSEEDPKKRIIHISSMTFVMLSSAMFKLNPEYQGVWQRVLWTGSFAWLTWSFSI